jgi:hypothetical protein
MEAIDAAIEQVGRATPAADYQAHLRERTGPPAQSVRGRWYLVAAAVAAAALLIGVAGAGWPRQRADHASDATSPVAIIPVVEDATPARAVKPTNRVVATAGRPIRARSVHARARATSRRDEFDVLVPAGQPEIIARLLASLHAQEPGVASQLVGQAVTRADVTQSAEAPVSVAPILIKAVEVPELLALEPVRAN